MRKILLTPLTLVLLAPLGAQAGHGKEKCNHPVEECLNLMVTSLKSTGFIGIEYDDEKKGPLTVDKVIPGTPAEKAGIQKGDVLITLNGIPFNKEGYKKMREVKKPGAEVVCVLERKGKKVKLTLKLAPMPADLMAKYIGEHMMSHAKEDKAVAAAP